MNTQEFCKQHKIPKHRINDILGETPEHLSEEQINRVLEAVTQPSALVASKDIQLKSNPIELTKRLLAKDVERLKDEVDKAIDELVAYRNNKLYDYCKDLASALREHKNQDAPTQQETEDLLNLELQLLLSSHD